MKSILNNPYYQHMHMEMNKKFGTDSQTNRLLWETGSSLDLENGACLCIAHVQRLFDRLLLTARFKRDVPIIW